MLLKLIGRGEEAGEEGVYCRIRGMNILLLGRQLRLSLLHHTVMRLLVLHYSTYSGALHNRWWLRLLQLCRRGRHYNRCRCSLHLLLLWLILTRTLLGNRYPD